MNITLNLIAGGVLILPIHNLISYTATAKGSVVIYHKDDKEHMDEVYEVPTRINNMTKEYHE